MYQIILGVLAVLPSVRGVAFPGPSPTFVANDNKAVVGWTPRPTQAPAVKLGKRQTDWETVSRNPGLCGWVELGGALVSTQALTCNSGLTCALYTATSVNMAGCCSQGDTQNCGWVNSCMNYEAYTKGSCDSECMSNSFLRVCTDSRTPYCVTWTYTSDQVADYGCATSPLGVLTVEQFASDTESVYTITLPTLFGTDVTGWDSQTSSVDSDTMTDVSTTVEPSDPEVTDPAPGSNGSNGTTPKPKTKKKSTPVAAIAGGVVGGLVVLFLMGAAIIFFCVKKRKAKQLANNQTIIAAQQAQSHQSELKPPVQSPPMPMQSPPPQGNGYFTPQDQKTNYQPQGQVHEQGPQSPVLSNPPTPAPPYIQPYYAAPNAPPLPAEGAAQYPAREGTYEVDAITSSQTRPVHQPNTFEMGPGK